MSPLRAETIDIVCMKMADDHSLELEERNVRGSQPAIDSLAKGSYLLGLPTEVRLDIFERALISPWTIRWQGKVGSKKLTHHHLVCNVAQYSPARYNLASLLLVCRKIYNEAASIFYRNNTFVYDLLSWEIGLSAPFDCATFTSNLHHLTIVRHFPGS